MRRLSLRIIAALFTFFIGVAVASVWMVSRISEREEPPCKDCGRSYSSSAIIPTITLCELSAHPEQYKGQTIRLRVVFHHDSGAIDIEDHTCAGGAAMYAGFVESFGSCDGAFKSLTIYSGYEAGYDSIAYVTVVGRFGRIEAPGNFYRGYDGFNIMCLERAEPIGSGIWQRVNYTVGRVSKYVGL